MDRAPFANAFGRTIRQGQKNGFVYNSKKKKQTRFKNISLFGCLLFRHGARYTRGTDFQREDPNNAKTLFPNTKTYIFP